MKKKLLALLMGTSLVLAACGGGDDEASGTGGDTIASAGDAEQIYSKNCVACHGDTLEGVGSNPNLTQVGSRLSQDEIKDVILNGRNGMPPQKNNLSEEEATTVAEWLSAKK